MLFFGESASHLKTHALEFAAKLLQCPSDRLIKNHHPDFFSIAPEGAFHAIDKIRKAIDGSHIAPFEAKAKLFLIEFAERMQPAAANALLKTLEEPPPNTYWVLCSSKPREILPTIRSRCQEFFVSAISEVPDSEEIELARALLASPPTYPKLSISLEKLDKLLDGEESQARVLELFSAIAVHFRDKEREQELPYQWEEPLQEALFAVQRNMKLSACLEVFFLKVGHVR
jgi:DNA polymerase III delta prime subunit